MDLSCVISCSFRHLEEIISLRVALIEVGVEVLAPKGSVVRGTAGVNGGVERFQLLDEDKTNDPAMLMPAFMANILEADFHYAYFPNGRCGLSVAAEICWAMYHGIPSIWSARPRTFSAEVYPDFVRTLIDFEPDGMLQPADLVERIKTGRITEALIREKKRRLQGFLSLFQPVLGPLKFQRVV